MCGIAGIVGGNQGSLAGEARIRAMLDAMAHRGPDDTGIWLGPAGAAVALGHRRLSIIDPEHGHQPMATADGALTVVFNGAIYNYLELRRELVARGHAVQTYSDTEVILHAYREWGEDCTARFRGMFAFALWDRERQRLFCARDRMGVKPFYYWLDGNRLVFASEIKAIVASGGYRPERDERALQDYLTFQFYLGDKTLFRNIRRLEPGHALVARVDGERVRLRAQRYWDLSFEPDPAHDASYFEDQLAFHLEDAVRLHLRSDVPLGAYLSGGLDSSAIVCTAAPMLEDVAFKTFTGAFDAGPRYDETRYARQVADYAGAENHELYVPIEELGDVLPRLVYYMDEPVAGPGLIPQYYVSRLAAQHVKVVLGGQGGDEVFIGYARYLAACLERCLRSAVLGASDRDGITLAAIAPSLPMLHGYETMLQHFWSDGLFGDEVDRYLRLMDRGHGFGELISPDAVTGEYRSADAFREVYDRPDLDSMVNRMSHFDLKASLPALLHVEDRMSMAVSLESRVPLLDHPLVELMARTPPGIKFANGRLRHLFLNVLKNRVPASVLERRDKMGFPVPLQQWYRGGGREFVRDTLLSDRARARGLYDPRRVESLLERESEFGRVVWGLLNLELWHRAFLDGEPAP